MSLDTLMEMIKLLLSRNKLGLILLIGWPTLIHVKRATIILMVILVTSSLSLLLMANILLKALILLDMKELKIHLVFL